jgi:hypothetical protein
MREGKRVKEGRKGIPEYSDPTKNIEGESERGVETGEGVPRKQQKEHLRVDCTGTDGMWLPCHCYRSHDPKPQTHQYPYY